MSAVVVIDSTSLEIPSGHAYLFADTSSESTVYKYQISTGTPHELTVGVLNALGVAPSSLPKLVLQSDLLDALSKTISSTTGVTVAHENKGSVSASYVERKVGNKVNKADFLTKIAVLEQKLADVASGVAFGPLSYETLSPVADPTESNEDAKSLSFPAIGSKFRTVFSEDDDGNIKVNAPVLSASRPLVMWECTVASDNENVHEFSFFIENMEVILGDDARVGYPTHLFTFFFDGTTTRCIQQSTIEHVFDYQAASEQEEQTEE